jgi:hypothetical protein
MIAEVERISSYISVPCARKFKLPWVANINVPWEIGLFPGNHTAKLSAFAARTSMFWLRRTLLNADLITYPCKGMWNFHFELAKLDHSAEIISHVGYRKGSTRYQNGQFRLAHAGKLGANEVTGRSVKALLLGLKAFSGPVAKSASE